MTDEKAEKDRSQLN